LGYNIFKEVQLRQNLGNMSDEQAVKAISQLYPYLPHFDEANARKQLPLFRRSCRDPDDLLFSHRMRFGTSQWTESFLAPGASAMNQWRESLSGWHGYQNRGPLGRAQELERLNLLHGYLLSSQGDRMGMAHGVEARCPFLDPKVVAFAQNCALESKLSGNTNEKAILKEAFKTLLPHQITARPKQPYRAMEAQCFIKSKPDWYLEAVDHQQLKHYDWLLPEKASFLFKKAELAYEKLSPREHQSLTFILSTVLLDHKFIKHMYAPQHNLGISILHMKT
jgi:asparagine synthase (glutamine-hydrolysing)